MYTTTSDMADDGHDEELQRQNAPRCVVPSLLTLEKAASIAVYLETLYGALLKPPRELSTAPPGNYVLSRERRRLALEEEMKRKHLSGTAKSNARRKWYEEEMLDLRDRRRKVDVRRFVNLQTIGRGEPGSHCIVHADESSAGVLGVMSLFKDRMDGRLFTMKEVNDIGVTVSVVG